MRGRESSQCFSMNMNILVVSEKYERAEGSTTHKIKEEQSKLKLINFLMSEKSRDFPTMQRIGCNVFYSLRDYVEFHKFY